MKSLMRPSQEREMVAVRHLRYYVLLFGIGIVAHSCPICYTSAFLSLTRMHRRSTLQPLHPIFVQQKSLYLRNYRPSPVRMPYHTFTLERKAISDEDGDLSDTGSTTTLHETLMKNNELSHMMIKVNSVNETIAFYTERGATTQSYRYIEKSGAESAFANFAPMKGILPPNNKGYFSLEIVKQGGDKQSQQNADSKRSNAIQFVGISMLTNFRDKSKLESVILSNTGKNKLPPLTVGDLGSTSSSRSSSKSSTAADLDPNGIHVQLVASAPGDGLAQLCLACQSKTTTLSDIEEFYVDILGMELVAQDKNCICLRYQSAPLNVPAGRGGDEESVARVGVPTTLVFTIPEKDTSGTSKGKYECFDHLVISTDDVSSAMEHIQTFLGTEKGEDDEEYIFMPPRPMFGTLLMGVKDPNGYDVYLMQRPKKEERTAP